MTHYYVAQSLDRPNSTVKSVEQVLHQSATRVFVLPRHELDSNLWQENSVFRQLYELIKGKKSHSFQTNEWSFRSDGYTVFKEKEPNLVKLFTTAVCLQSQKNQPMDYVLFVSGPTFRPLYDLVNISHIGIDPYLIWDQGRLGVWPEQMNIEKDKALLWSGAGSCSLDQRRWQSNPRNPKKNWRQDSYEAIRPILNERATALVEAHDALADKKSHDAWMQPNLRVAHRLLRYLPPKWNEDAKRWRGYGYDAVARLTPLHGPIPWRGWRAELFDDLERDLIFESWLVPFKGAVTGQWFLQPGSLLMLYWAFDIVGIDPGMSADDFIQQHNWKDWFGERIV